MAKMDKYEEMFEGLDLSDEFKRSFLMAKGIDEYNGWASPSNTVK